MAEEKTVLLLGGSGGIGSALADGLRAAGWKVSAPGRAELDLEKPASIDVFFAKNPAGFYAVVQCAGFNNPKPFETLTRADVSRTMEINVMGFFDVLRRAVPLMKQNGKGGRILAVSSIYGSFSRAGRLAYSMSKHALNGMVKTLALELAPHGITVNSLAPGFVATEMTTRNNPPEVVKELESRIPVGRLARPDEIAATALFLLGPAASYINGAVITADGGYSAGGFQK